MQQNIDDRIDPHFLAIQPEAQAKIQAKAEIWIDGSSILRTGVALDYQKLLQIVHEELRKECDEAQFDKLPPDWLSGCYYDHTVPEGKSPDGKRGRHSQTEDSQQLEWQQQEQQRAQKAGFTLRLSPSWSERVRCLFCSCLNAVHFPAPALLDLQGDLAALATSTTQAFWGTTAIFLLSDNPALLFNLSKQRFGGCCLLQSGGVRLLALDDNLASLLSRSQNFPDKQRSSIQKACDEALQIELDNVEWLEED